MRPVRRAGLRLLVDQPEGPDWTAAEAQLEAGMVAPMPTLEIHLDPLCHHGLTGWTETNGTAPMGWFDEHAIDRDDERRCAESAIDAATNASPALVSSAILVLPELAATPPVLQSVQEHLWRAPGPALTAVGLYHADAPADAIDPALLGGAQAAGHINEAVVLGPSGDVLWRHRKLSRAEGLPATKGGTPPVEDIVLGDTVKVIPTPAGVVTIAICLDTFQPQSRERLMTSGADMVLVPSLSPRALRHRDSLQHLVQSVWGGAFVCNRGFLLKDGPNGPVDQEPIWNEETARSFWAIARTTLTLPPKWTPGPHPSFVFRAQDEALRRRTQA